MTLYFHVLVNFTLLHSWIYKAEFIWPRHLIIYLSIHVIVLVRDVYNFSCSICNLFALVCISKSLNCICPNGSCCFDTFWKTLKQINSKLNSKLYDDVYKFVHWTLNLSKKIPTTEPHLLKVKSSPVVTEPTLSLWSKVNHTCWCHNVYFLNSTHVDKKLLHKRMWLLIVCKQFRLMFYNLLLSMTIFVLILFVLVKLNQITKMSTPEWEHLSKIASYNQLQKYFRHSTLFCPWSCACDSPASPYQSC